MSLNSIPVLDESWSLYDWSNWQSSRDALVQGTPTRYFAKEAWNAIVDSIAEALEAAGLAWDNTYTTAEGAKITVAYGKLTAQKFNSVRHNIDRPAPLGWAWAERKDFRGYVGRENFRGSSTHGKDRDKVYPEYIIELVRKLNLLLEIMRGTAMISDAEALYLASVFYEADVTTGRAAHVETSRISSVKQSTEARTGKGVLTTATQKAFTSASVEAAVERAVPASISLKIPPLLQVEGESKQGIPMESNVPVCSIVNADVEAEKCIETAVDTLSATAFQAEVNAHEASPVEAQAVSSTVSEAVILQKEPLPFAGEAIMASKAEAEVVQEESLPMGAAVMLSVQLEVTAKKCRAAPMITSHQCGVKMTCELDTAWYPPEWIDGGLWIRQSHSVTQNENGELVIV